MSLRWLFLLPISFALHAQGAADPSGQTRVAVALTNLRFYDDSTFTRPTEQNFREGELFEVFAETVREHADNANDQKFKWFKVESRTGAQGWVYGNEVAIILADNEVESVMKPFHKQKFHFSNGFEETTLWVGQIEGHDNFYEQEVRNPLYRELYLVASAASGYSVCIPIATLSTQGRSKLQGFNLRDINGDSIPELLLELSSNNTNTQFDQKKIEIYAFQSGSLVRVFEEQCSLNWNDDEPAPAFSKTINIATNTLRVAYIEYNDNQNRSTADNQIRGLNYVTYSYRWDPVRKNYKTLYSESRVPLTAIATNVSPLFDSNTAAGNFVDLVQKGTELVVKSQGERLFSYNNTDVLDCMFEVVLPNGKTGWMAANTLKLQAQEYSDLLNKYNTHPPIKKSDWQSDKSFVVFED